MIRPFADGSGRADERRGKGQAFDAGSSDHGHAARELSRGPPGCCCACCAGPSSPSAQLTAASVLFSYLYRVNETIYDPSLFAIGVGGLFSHGLRRHADAAVAQQPAAHGAAQRQGALRGTGRQRLGAEGGRSARHEPARSAGRPDRAPRQRRPHHLCQRRLLRAGRRAARGAARHDRGAAVAPSRAATACCPTARACTTSRS